MIRSINSNTQCKWHQLKWDCICSDWILCQFSTKSLSLSTYTSLVSHISADITFQQYPSRRAYRVLLNPPTKKLMPANDTNSIQKSHKLNWNLRYIIIIANIMFLMDYFLNPPSGHQKSASGPHLFCYYCISQVEMKFRQEWSVSRAKHSICRDIAVLM